MRRNFAAGAPARPPIVCAAGSLAAVDKGIIMTSLGSFARRAALASVAAFALGACSGQSDSAQSGGDKYMTAESAPAAAENFARDASSPAPPPSPQPPNHPGAQGGVMLAYSYAFGITAPKQTIAPMISAHEKKCADAGPAVCQVLGSSVNSWGEDQVSAYLNIRAEPIWLGEYRASLAGDAEGAGGKVSSNTVSTEDLTSYIIDTQARLDAKTALRDRIRKLLEEREGSLNDVLAAERALSDVQGEIDSMTAQLEAAKARVAMSALSISYQSDPETSTGAFKPLGEAFSAFGRTLVASLAEVVNFVARAIIPFALALGALALVLAILKGVLKGRKKA